VIFFLLVVIYSSAPRVISCYTTITELLWYYDGRLFLPMDS